MTPAIPPTAPPTARQLQRGYIGNDRPANLTKFQARLNGMIIGTFSSVRINIIGDSHSSSAGVALASNSLGARMAADFTALGFSGVHSRLGLYQDSIALTQTFYPRWAFTGAGWGPWQALPGGKSARTTGSGEKLVDSPGYSFDKYLFYYYQDPANGSVTITVDGGATSFSTPSSGGSVTTQTLSQAGTAGIVTLLITIASAGVHTVEFTQSSGAIQIYGGEAYTSTAKTVFVRSMGYVGYSSVNYVANNIPSRFTDPALYADLIFACIGDNDFFNSVSLATYATNIATLKTNLLQPATASLVFWTWPPAAVSYGAISVQQGYVNAFLAGAGTNVLTVNLFQRYLDIGGGPVELPERYFDLIHTNAFGTLDEEKMLLNAVLPLGV